MEIWYFNKKRNENDKIKILWWKTKICQKSRWKHKTRPTDPWCNNAPSFRETEKYEVASFCHTKTLGMDHKTTPPFTVPLTNLFQWNKSWRVSRTNTRSSVAYWFIRHWKLAQVMTNHFGLKRKTICYKRDSFSCITLSIPIQLREFFYDLHISTVKSWEFGQIFLIFKTSINIKDLQETMKSLTVGKNLNTNFQFPVKILYFFCIFSLCSVGIWYFVVNISLVQDKKAI